MKTPQKRIIKYGVFTFKLTNTTLKTKKFSICKVPTTTWCDTLYEMNSDKKLKMRLARYSVRFVHDQDGELIMKPGSRGNTLAKAELYDVNITDFKKISEHGRTTYKI